MAAAEVQEKFRINSRLALSSDRVDRLERALVGIADLPDREPLCVVEQASAATALRP